MPPKCSKCGMHHMFGECSKQEQFMVYVPERETIITKDEVTSFVFDMNNLSPTEFKDKYGFQI